MQQDILAGKRALSLPQIQVGEASKDQVGWLEKVGYASGDLAFNLIFQTITIFLTIFYTDVFGLAPMAVSGLFLVARIWDAVNDPIMGVIVDKTNTRWGKFRPHLLWGAIPFAITGILCFSTPNFGESGKVVYAYVTYIALGMVYTMVSTPYGALTSAITQDPRERATLSVIRMIGATFGMLLVSVGIPVLLEFFGRYGSAAQSYQRIMTIYSIVGALLLVFCFRNTKERYSVPGGAKLKFQDLKAAVMQNRPLLVLCLLFLFVHANMAISTAVGAYFFTYIFGNSAAYGIFNLCGTLPMLVMMFFIPALLKRFDKKTLFLFGSLGMVLQPLYLMFCPATQAGLMIAYVVKVFQGIFYAFNFGLVWSLVPDTIEYGELISGNRTEGIIYALVGFFYKFGMALAGVIPGIVLQLVGYLPNVEQTALSLTGIRLLNSVFPLLLTILTVVATLWYPLNEKRNYQILEELKARKAA